MNYQIQTEVKVAMEVQENKTHYIKCDCGSEIMTITQDDEIDELYYVSIFKFYTHRYTWKDKLRHIWQIIRHGTPWNDQMVLRRDELNKIKEII